MIISRTHYTIDILIAYWLTNFVFRCPFLLLDDLFCSRIYHAYCELDECLERRKSILYQLWLLRVVDWLEENIVPGRVTHEFAVPWTAVFQPFCFTSGHHKQISIVSCECFLPFCPILPLVLLPYPRLPELINFVSLRRARIRRREDAGRQQVQLCASSLFGDSLPRVRVVVWTSTVCDAIHEVFIRK